MDLDGKCSKRSSSLQSEVNDEKRKRSMKSLINEVLLQEKFIEELSDIYRCVI